MWRRIHQGFRLLLASARAVGAATAFVGLGGAALLTAFLTPLLDYLGGWKYLAAAGLLLILVGAALSLVTYLAAVRIVGTLDALNAFLLEVEATEPQATVVLSPDPQTKWDLEEARRERILPLQQEHRARSLARYQASHRGRVKRAMRDLRILGVDSYALDRKGATVERGSERVDMPLDFHDLFRIRDLLADGVAQLGGGETL